MCSSAIIKVYISALGRRVGHAVGSQHEASSQQSAAQASAPQHVMGSQPGGQGPQLQVEPQLGAQPAGPQQSGAQLSQQVEGQQGAAVGMAAPS